ncbi:MAG: hypothetical protein ACJ741_01890 [Pyrinomonadaceae bacterium]
MKLYPLATAICLLCVITTGAQTKPERETMGLKGAVKIVREERVDVSPQDGQPLPNGRREVSTMTFDEQGRELDHSFSNPDGTPRKKRVFVHDAQGNVVEEDSYNASGTLVGKEFSSYRFDEAGRLLERIVHNGAGVLQYNTVIAYDARGNRTDFAMYEADGTMITRTVNSYDDEGKLQDSTMYSRGGKLVAQTTRARDTGKMSLVADPDGAFKRLAEIPNNYREEEFDAHGNWTKRTIVMLHTKSSGKPEEVLEVTRRTISYY